MKLIRVLSLIGVSSFLFLVTGCVASSFSSGLSSVGLIILSLFSFFLASCLKRGHYSVSNSNQAEPSEPSGCEEISPKHIFFPQSITVHEAISGEYNSFDISSGEAVLLSCGETCQDPDSSGWGLSVSSTNGDHTLVVDSSFDDGVSTYNGYVYANLSQSESARVFFHTYDYAVSYNLGSGSYQFVAVPSSESHDRYPSNNKIDFTQSVAGDVFILNPLIAEASVYNPAKIAITQGVHKIGLANGLSFNDLDLSVPGVVSYNSKELLHVYSSPYSWGPPDVTLTVDDFSSDYRVYDENVAKPESNCLDDIDEEN